MEAPPCPMGRRGVCRGKAAPSEEELTAPSYKEIGRLKMEIDWLNKSFERSPEETPGMNQARARSIVARRPVRAARGEPDKLLLRTAGHGERRLAGSERPMSLHRKGCPSRRTYFRRLELNFHRDKC